MSANDSLKTMEQGSKSPKLCGCHSLGLPQVSK